jgi:hypothetical protein
VIPLRYRAILPVEHTTAVNTKVVVYGQGPVKADQRAAAYRQSLAAIDRNRPEST